MTSLRLWIVVLGCTSFLAGLACGPWLARRFAPAPRSARVEPFGDYERALAQRFALDPTRRDLLRALLSNYEREIGTIKDSHMADYMSAMEPELSAKGAEYSAYVRDRVLPVERRAEFDQLAANFVASPH